MPPRVYVETTIINYLTAWPSRDVVIAGHQQVTREWWRDQRSRFELLTSELVLREAAAGDPDAAQERLEILVPLAVLKINDLAVELADALIRRRAMPETVPEDALHVAIAVANGLDFLVTWNFVIWQTQHSER